MGFNKAQAAAIHHHTGPALVLAGPGSGKTTVITHRIQYLTQECAVPPSKILVITFTKMAANEMKERFLKLAQQSSGAVTFGTFHAIYFNILKHSYHYSAQQIIRSDKQIEFLREQISNYQIEMTDENEFCADILSEISRVKNERVDLTDYHPSSCSQSIFQDIFAKYDQMLKRKRLIDFDDMLLYCYELLYERPDILSAWQDKYQYILIDEFQDINQIQFDVINLISSKYRNLFVVGDDDQSIYGFRGAKPDIMLNFKNTYPEATQIALSANYRSTSHIVNASKSLIDHNQIRFRKEMNTINEEGGKVWIKQFEDFETEILFVADQLKQAGQTQDGFHQCAVLTRTNAGAQQLIQVLIEQEIPYHATDPIQNIFDHWIAKDMCAYLQIAEGNRERKQFLRIINKPLRYLSRESLITPLVDFEQWKQFYREKEWMVRRIENFCSDLSMIQSMSPFAALNYIRKGIGYDSYLAQYAKEYRVNYDNLLEIIEVIHESTKKIRTHEEWFSYIETYIQKLEEQKNNQETDNAVQICTLHSSKGLEYDNVFIIDVNEGMIPYHKAILDPEIEEERRMFYVGMTRAKKKLVLCYTNQRFNKKMYESRFLSEIDAAHSFIDIIKKGED